MLNYAMSESDRYVWLYSEQLRWWPPTNAPKAYIDALRLAKKGPGPGEKNPLRTKPTLAEMADLRVLWNGKHTLMDELSKDKTEILDLTAANWHFTRDEQDKGMRRGWYRPSFNDSAWRAMPIAKFWEECGEDYDGYGWYRTTFVAPKIDTGKKAYLLVGAINHAAWIWLNGKKVGQKDMVINGWNTAFLLDVTRELKPGENKLAIRVYNLASCGGVWKPIKLMVQ
jgi:hypothetical protein